MGADRAVYSARTARRSQTFGRCAGNSQRHFLCADDGLPMAGAAERFAAEEYNAFLFCAVGSGRHAGARPRGALCRCSRSSGPRGQSKRRDHRQPVCESRSKRGSKIDPQGFDAGKKVTGRKRHILVDTLGLLLGVSCCPQTFKTVMGRVIYCGGRGGVFHSLSASSPTLDIRGRKWPRQSPQQETGRSRSSNAQTITASSSCPSVGSSSFLYSAGLNQARCTTLPWVL